MKYDDLLPPTTGRRHAHATGPDPDIGTVWSHYTRFWRYPGTVRQVCWYGGAVVTGAVIALCVLAGGGR